MKIYDIVTFKINITSINIVEKKMTIKIIIHLNA